MTVQNSLTIAERQKLVTENLPYAYYWVGRYRYCNVPTEEIRQAALEGLCIAAKQFNPEKHDFTNYARRCICRYIAHTVRTFPIAHIKRFGTSLFSEFSCHGLNETFEYTKVRTDPRTADKVNGRSPVTVPSGTHHDDYDTRIAYWDLERLFTSKQRPKHWQILRMYYMADMSSRTIATELGISRSRVNQILAEAFDMIDGSVSSNRYRSYHR